LSDNITLQNHPMRQNHGQARPLSLVREVQDGYFSGSTPTQVRVVLTRRIKGT
jgi:hypothetical protein